MNDPVVMYEIFASSGDEDWHGTMQKERRPAPSKTSLPRSFRSEVYRDVYLGSRFIAVCVSGDTIEGIPWIQHVVSDFQATGAVLGLPYFLALKAEALHLADRTSEALRTIEEAETVVRKTHERQHLAELQRLRGVFLASMGADESQIEASFFEAINIAKQQRSIWLEKRVEATYAEYRGQKASGLGGRGFRLPLC